ncbi:MAG: ubiquinol-cytochrome c reductase iron-sulfur subunit [Rhodomicrobium sp.]
MTRREVLYAATTSVIVLGVAAALWPVIDQMNPDASVKLPEVDVDLSSIGPGQSLTVMWQHKPIFIRNREPEDIIKARATPLSVLADTEARVMDAEMPLPATDENRTKTGEENWLVVVGLCTHDSCVLSGQKAEETRGDYGGWFCPCCAAHYDTSGRTRTGIARQNLRVPPYRFASASRLIIGCGLCRATFLG